MKSEVYKKLYFRAFNRLSELIHEAQQIQVELEDLYMELLEEESENDEQ